MEAVGRFASLIPRSMLFLANLREVRCFRWAGQPVGSPSLLAHTALVTSQPAAPRAYIEDKEWRQARGGASALLSFGRKLVSASTRRDGSAVQRTMAAELVTTNGTAHRIITNGAAHHIIANGGAHYLLMVQCINY